MTTIDWDALLGVAIGRDDTRALSLPHFPAGAAGPGADGRIVSGCNVENAGYGVSLCAEWHGLDLIRTGGRHTRRGCRQRDWVPALRAVPPVTYEHGGPPAWSSCQVQGNNT